MLLIAAVLALVVGGTKMPAQNLAYKLSFDDEQIAGPATASERPAWIAAMRSWRTEQLAAISYDGALYERPDVEWTRHAFIESQMMVEDRTFYDPEKRAYTVRKYVDGVQRRYGGVDTVLVWPTYPNIGIDDRNTVDMFLSMPGGVAGLRSMVADFHKAGVKVLLPIHPWDIGTREPDQGWPISLPALMARIRADGLMGDTMDAVPKVYWDNSIADGRPLVLEPEGGLDGSHIDQLGWDKMSWGYWNTDHYAPEVSKVKWLEPRHMVHVCDRWSTNKANLIQDAFFNGAGIETWENVWSIWNQMTDRDCEAVRRISTIEHQFSALLCSNGWEPYTPTIQSATVFASKWPSADGDRTLWTLINRGDTAVSGGQIEAPYSAGAEFYDVWSGRMLTPHVSGDRAILSFGIEAHGYGAVLEIRNGPPDSGLDRFLAGMRRYAKRPLSSFSTANLVLNQKMVPINATAAASTAPAGMVLIPGAKFNFKVHGIEIEGKDNPGVDVQYPWETEPHLSHDHTIAISPFYIDEYPVTNAQFKVFLAKTHYAPADSRNFLKDWHDGQYPAGWDNKPVTWVSLDDARAYASWAGKRLPHEWEWQYAAQGSDGRIYPWGNEWDESKMPQQDKSRTLAPPADVSAFGGASPFGVMDLVGNTWQWTDEYSDEHTRSAIVRGGSYYKPQGSDWYFPQAYRLDEHGKYLLMAPSRDRSGTIGFRCVKDARG